VSRSAIAQRLAALEARAAQLAAKRIAVDFAALSDAEFVEFGVALYARGGITEAEARLLVSNHRSGFLDSGEDDPRDPRYPAAARRALARLAAMGTLPA
jgi:hypothetical protein